MRGVCIASWHCDGEGNEFEHHEESKSYSSRDTRIVDEVKKLSQAPRLLSGQGHLSSITSDTRVSASVANTHGYPELPTMYKLRSLLHDAEQAFHAVLDRNSALESEVTMLRDRLNDLEKRFVNYHNSELQLGSHELTPLPIGGSNRDESYSLNIFDISTPPRYKENVKPHAIARTHTSRDQRQVKSTQQPRSLSVFNS